MTKNKSKLIYKLLLLFILSFSIQAFSQQPNYIISTEESLTESVKLVPCKKEERFEAVKKLFVQMGAKDDEITIEKFNRDKISNIVLRKKGKTDETIIIGAHYDKVDDGCGAIDNWTGIAIIAHLFKTLNQIETRKSYIFVAFDQEEKGLLGSNEMAKAIPKENRQNYCAMLNFDSFGLAAPMALENASSSKMISLAKKMAEESKFKFADITLTGTDADSSSFKSRNIPAITVVGLNNNWMNILHSRNDKIENIDMKSVYFGYRVALMLAGKLDAAGCQDYK